MSAIPRLPMILGLAALLSLWGAAAQRLARSSASSLPDAQAFSNYLGDVDRDDVRVPGLGARPVRRTHRPQLYLVMLIVWALMLAWSKPWLDRFRYGPLEWLWRCLTYGSGSRCACDSACYLRLIRISFDVEGADADVRLRLQCHSRMRTAPRRASCRWRRRGGLRRDRQAGPTAASASTKPKRSSSKSASWPRPLSLPDACEALATGGFPPFFAFLPLARSGCRCAHMRDAAQVRRATMKGDPQGHRVPQQGAHQRADRDQPVLAALPRAAATGASTSSPNTSGTNRSTR